MVCESCSAIAASFILIGYYAVKIKHLVYTKTVINSAYGIEKKTKQQHCEDNSTIFRIAFTDFTQL